MKCDFCKRDQDELKEIFSPIFKEIENEIKFFENKIKNNKEDFSKDNGFTKNSFDKADKINDIILNMKIETVLGDIDNFLKLDINIAILYKYLKDFKPEISYEKSIKDLLIMFKDEPTKERLQKIETSYIKQKEDLMRRNSEIKNKFNTFTEIDVEFDIPLNIFDFNDSTIIYIVDKINNEGYKSKKIRLCPYCKYLFEDLTIKIQNAKEKARKSSLNVIQHNSSNDIPMYPSWDTND
jgi:glutaredoxin